MSNWYVEEALQHTGREGYVVLQPVEGEEPQHVAECLFRDDAELLAAAPDLCAAATDALARIESDIDTPNQKAAEGEALRAALAKARGEEKA